MLAMIASINILQHAHSKLCTRLACHHWKFSTIMMSRLLHTLIILSTVMCHTMCNAICTFMSTYLSNKNSKCFYSTQLQSILSAYNMCHPRYTADSLTDLRTSSCFSIALSSEVNRLNRFECGRRLNWLLLGSSFACWGNLAVRRNDSSAG